MASPLLSVTEFREMAETGSGDKIHAGKAPVVKHQTISIGGSHLESNPFQGETRFIRVKTNTNCCIDIGFSPAATALMMPMDAGQTEYFGVGGNYVISVIANP